jgi:hypothetical protein
VFGFVQTRFHLTMFNLIWNLNHYFLKKTLWSRLIVFHIKSTIPFKPLHHVRAQTDNKFYNMRPCVSSVQTLRFSGSIFLSNLQRLTTPRPTFLNVYVSSYLKAPNAFTHGLIVAALNSLLLLDRYLLHHFHFRHYFPAIKMEAGFSI